MAINEHQVLGMILSGDQEGNAPVGEEMLGEVLSRREIEAVGADRVYDSDRPRVLLAVAGKGR